MRIRWDIEDGYAGKSRPHFVDVPDEDLEDLDEAEQNEVIEEHVKQAFEDTIYYYWKRT
jgi:hypothetical protein